MGPARRAYAVLIRTPFVGPFARLPLRSLRWLIQPPDLDPVVLSAQLASDLRLQQAQLAQLAQAYEALRRDQERTRLITFMLSGQVSGRDKAEAERANLGRSTESAAAG